jgi:NADH pyrophosphatase NudC (nudix superfamily)
MSKEKQIEKEIEEMAHSLRIRKLDNEKIGFDVLSRLAGMEHEDEETSIARHIVTQLGYRKQSEGEWTYGVDREGTMKCTLCRRRMPKIEHARYCPNCGAKMKGGEE